MSWNYTLSGAGAEAWTPRFFYQGARYLEVECTAPAGTDLPVVAAIEARIVHADVATAGSFECSNELFNRIATLVRWAQRSNTVSVLTDCPHRERLGWMEQYYLNGSSLRYHFDLTRFYTKGLNDMADAQRPNGLVPDIAPEYVRFANGFLDSPEWGSAYILTAWQQFIWTGDETALRRHYAGMQRYSDYLTSRAENRILLFGLGDWFDLGPDRPGVAQLTPIALTATAIYYEDALTLQRIASRLGRAQDAARYAAAAAEIATAFNAKLFDAVRANYATGSQTANAMPLVLGLVPEGKSPAVMDAIAADVRAHDNGLTAGDVGYRYLLRALADGDRSDVIFGLNNQTGKPGYGYQLAQGATSLTEAWDAARHASQNHFMLSQIIEWFFQDLAGLAPDPEAPGFGRVIVRPSPVGDLMWAHASYASVRGPIEVQWRSINGRLTVRVTIPANSSALVQLPVAPGAAVMERGVPAASAPGVTSVAPVRGRATFAVGSGRYHFECPTPTILCGSISP